MAWGTHIWRFAFREIKIKEVETPDSGTCQVKCNHDIIYIVIYIYILYIILSNKHEDAKVLGKHPHSHYLSIANLEIGAAPARLASKLPISWNMLEHAFH